MDPRLSAALVGRYAIDREIGRGGMATVYLARDVKHNRNVALKVLNPELGAVLGVERFLSEIQVTANLQHPNLLPLFDSGEANGLLFYVMPYVEGESLRARLEREKQLPVDEAIRIAVSIANALAYAHGHGVIHRDLKPENILMQAGQAVIADFGIALAVSNAGGARVTQTGLSLGTPQYMSPEQATGDRIVDGRTDIYSLGAMTYEMLVGDPPHVASTAQAIIAKVLTEKPASVRTSRPNVSPAVEYAIGRALEKLAADRFATAKEFADALEGKGAAATSAAYQSAGAAPSANRGSRLRELSAWSMVAVLAAWFGWQHMRPRTEVEAPVIRANFDLQPGQRVNDALAGTTIAVSPKGDVIAYTSIGGGAGLQTFIRHVNALTVRVVTDADKIQVSGRNLTFSPDGRWLAFTEGNVLKKVSVDGGQAVNVSPTLQGSVPYGISWGVNDTIYVGSFQGLEALPAAGGKSVVIGHKDSASVRFGQRWPLALPDGRTVLFATGNSASDAPHLAVLDLRTHEVTVHDLQLAVLLGLLDGHLVYVDRGGTIMAVRFDAKALRPVGEPVQLEDGVVVDPTSGAKASVSASGTLVYLRGRAEYQPVTTRGGTEMPVPFIRELHVYANPRFSPDGRRVAITMTSAQASDIYIYDTDRNTFTRLTTEGANARPEWTPDGKRIVFRSERAGKVGIWWQPIDGTGPAELLYAPPVEPFEAIVSPDSKWLVFRTAPGSTYPRDILAVPLEGEKTIVPLATGPGTESMPRISPDGKWLAYEANETGRFEIYVRPFPGSGTGVRVPVSSDGGSEPIWARSGRALYYRDAAGTFTEVTLTTGANFSIGQRRVVLTGDYIADASHAAYDVGPDGRFLLLKRSGAESQTIVVHNWGRELREKTAPKK
jgi:serine/threonine-protein kinase